MPISSKDNRQTSGSWERLAHISGHFLSDDQQIVQGKPRALVLPVLMDKHDDIPLLLKLSQAFHAERSTAVVLHIGRQYAQTAVNGREESPAVLEAHIPFTRECDWMDRDTVLERMVEVLGAREQLPDVILVPLAVVHPTILKLAGRALLLTPASTAGVRRSYLRIKKCIYSGITPSLGVIMLGSDAHGHVQTHADKLAAGVQQFLKHEITCCGHLPTVIGPAEVHHAEIGSLRKVVRQIIRDFLPSTQACAEQYADYRAEGIPMLYPIR